MKTVSKKIKVLFTFILIVLLLAIGAYILIKNRASADSFVAACYPSKTGCGMLTGKVVNNGLPLNRALIEVNLYGDTSKAQMTTDASGYFKIWLKVGYKYKVDIIPRKNGYTYNSDKQSFYDIKVTKVGASNPTQTFTYTGPNLKTPTPTPTSARSTIASATPSPTNSCGNNIKPGNLLELNRCNNYQNGKYIGGIVVTKNSARQETPVIAKLWAFKTLEGGSMLGSPTSYTDSNGVFANIGPLTSGSYTIRVESDGCQTKSFPVKGSDRLIYDQSNKFVLVCNYTQASSLSGIITKQSNGAAVPNAEVKLMYNDSELSKQYTDSTGRYNFMGIKPATYSLTITADRCELYKGVLITVGANENKIYNFPWLKCN